MKTLFVCYANIGRSQTAMALYNYWTKTATADSAGTGVDEVAPDCKTLGEFEPKGHRRPSTLTALSEKLAIDANDFTRKQLIPEMLSQYDLVVNIADRNQTPDWLRGDNVIWWKVLDLGPEFTRERLWQNYDILADKVKKLIDLEKTSNNFHELDDNIDEEQN